MGELKITSKIPIPAEASEPLEELDIFYRSNAYKIEMTNEENTRRYLRGKKGKGFWTSDLTVLPTVVHMEILDGYAMARYEVDTSGQRLSEEDRGFWKREGLAAAKFLETGEISSLVDTERDRADQIRADFTRRGVWYGAIIGGFLFAALMFWFR